jgi:hypothetical protein
MIGSRDFQNLLIIKDPETGQESIPKNAIHLLETKRGTDENENPKRKGIEFHAIFSGKYCV